MAVNVLLMDTKKPNRRLDALHTFIRSSPYSRDTLAHELGISVSYLHRLITGACIPSADLCVRIERATMGAVTRVCLRPDLFGDAPAMRSVEEKRRAAG